MIPYTQNVLILTSTATKVMGFFPKYDSGILQAGFIGFGYEFPASGKLENAYFLLNLS